MTTREASNWQRQRGGGGGGNVNCNREKLDRKFELQLVATLVN